VLIQMLLEPGGYIQWDERDLYMRMVGPLSNKTRANEALLDEKRDVAKKLGSDFG
jgi:hypothetical protein